MPYALAIDIGASSGRHILGEYVDGNIVTTVKPEDGTIIKAFLWNGLSLLETLTKEKKKENVIIISAKDSLEDKVQGLDLGADDYLPKPFHLAELVARVKSVIRRNHREGAAYIEYGNIRIFPDQFQVTIEGKNIELNRKEYDILHYFIQRPDRVINKTTLAEGTNPINHHNKI